MIIRSKEIQSFERASMLPEQSGEIAREQQSLESSTYWEKYRADLKDRLWEHGERRYLGGAKRFKREILGLCGSATIKTLDELNEVFVRLKIVSTSEEGASLTKYLIDNVELQYAHAENYDWTKLLRFERISNFQGDKEAVKVTKMKIYIPRQEVGYYCKPF